MTINVLCIILCIIWYITYNRKPVEYGCFWEVCMFASKCNAYNLLHTLVTYSYNN